MGWNQGYEIFEATVIGAYDLGKLDLELLAVLMEPYRGTDIDQGGSQGLMTKDGKSVEEVIMGMHGGSLPPRPQDDAPDEEVCDWYEKAGDLFNDITKKKYGWD